jgi:hypothetical protein
MEDTDKKPIEAIVLLGKRKRWDFYVKEFFIAQGKKIFLKKKIGH